MIKIDVRLDDNPLVPAYLQIVQQVKHLVARGQLKTGDRLPPVRELARDLSLNPGTVAGAYMELKRSGVVATRRGGGSFISGKSDDTLISAAIEERLTSIINRSVVEALSQGFTPEEIEASFTLHLSRWRQERSRKRPEPVSSEIISGRTVTLVGSSDLAVEVLAAHLKQQRPPVILSVTSAGSLGGLMALAQGKCHLAGIHLLDEETGQYNLPFIRRILPGREIIVLRLAGRVQGLMFLKGNPLHIRGLEDLKRPEITIANRQRGSGTRVLLDYHLHRLGIEPRRVKGYDSELDTHIQVASSVAGGTAGTGLGIQAAAKAFNLDFLPLFKESYDLVIPAEIYTSKLIAPLAKVIRTERFKKVVSDLGGYDVADTGKILSSGTVRV